MGKAAKAVTKVASSAVKATGKVVENTVNATGKVASGDIKGGLGQLTDTYAGALADVYTGGNADKVNALSGGGIDSLKGAYRGNSKDIIRTGITAASAYYGGAGTAFLVNNAQASGASPVEAIIMGASGAQGENMSWLNDAAGILNSDIGKNLTSSILGNNKPQTSSAPAPAAAPSIVYAPAPSSGMSTNMIMGIVGGGLALVLVLIFAMKGKR
jgi:hypothetical protein